MTEHEEFAIRALDTYVLMFPDDPKVVQLKEARRKLEEAIDELGRFLD